MKVKKTATATANKLNESTGLFAYSDAGYSDFSEPPMALAL